MGSRGLKKITSFWSWSLEFLSRYETFFPASSFHLLTALEKCSLRERRRILSESMDLCEAVGRSRKLEEINGRRKIMRSGRPPRCNNCSSRTMAVRVLGWPFLRLAAALLLYFGLSSSWAARSAMKCEPIDWRVSPYSRGMCVTPTHVRIPKGGSRLPSECRVAYLSFCVRPAEKMDFSLTTFRITRMALGHRRLSVPSGFFELHLNLTEPNFT